MNTLYIIAGFILLIFGIAFIVIQIVAGDDSDKPNWL